MMYTSEMNVKVHNTYLLELVDATTGVVKRTAKAENVVCNAFYTGYSLAYMITRIRLGTGTGTPAATDTALFTHKYNLDGSQSAAKYNDTTIRITVSATSPLGNTGNFTEVGLGRNSLLSHALITDAEGNPITVTQTDTDILNITAYVYIELTFSDATFIYPVRPSALLLAAYNETNSSNYAINLFTPSSVKVYLTDCVHTRTPNSVDSLSMNSGVSVDSTNGASARIGVSSGNTGYYSYIVIGIKYGYSGNRVMPVGFIALPNAAVFSPYSATALPVGTGDGTTTQFRIPLDTFVANSDTVYVNGVAMTRGTDYTIDGNANSNKRICLSAGNMAPVTGETYAGGIGSRVPSGWFSTDQNYKHRREDNKPAVFDFTDIADRRVNYIQMPIVYGYGNNGVSYTDITYESGYLKLENSDDGITYETVADVHYTNNNPDTPTLTFAEPVSKRYWRLTPHNSYYRVYCVFATTPGFLGFTKDYALEFTNAPAADAAITMNCQLDRPYKSSNYVIDLAGSITMTNG